MAAFLNATDEAGAQAALDARPDAIDPDPTRDGTAMAKRSVVIAGHKTSVSLENAFWAALKAAAARRSVTVNQLVTEIDGRRACNLSSALRVFLLAEAGVVSGHGEDR
jgi:predicted DNA-binding ribbon-helix-helix protein